MVTSCQHNFASLMICQGSFNCWAWSIRKSSLLPVKDFPRDVNTKIDIKIRLANHASSMRSFWPKTLLLNTLNLCTLSWKISLWFILWWDDLVRAAWVLPGIVWLVSTNCAVLFWQHSYRGTSSGLNWWIHLNKRKKYTKVNVTEEDSQ